MQVFDPTTYLPAWAQNQPRPMRQALHAIFALMDNSRGVDLQIAALRHIGQPTETLRLIATIDAAGETPITEVLSILTACRGENAGRHANILARPDPEQMHPWIFIDDLPKPRAEALAAAMPALVIETSRDNCQLRILADRPLSAQDRAQIQKTLQQRLQSDVGSTSGEKWGRLPGFTNQKRDKAGQWTNIIEDSIGVIPPVSATALLSLHPQGGVCTTGVSSPLSSPLSPAAAASSRPSAGSLLSSLSSSPHTKEDFAREALARPLPNADERAQGWRQEYADCCQALRAGLPHSEIIESLAQRALERGKRRTAEAAERYAQQVLDAALKSEPQAA